MTAGVLIGALPWANYGVAGIALVLAAWVLVAGFGAVLFTYFAVNLWVSGLHSYAGV